MAKRKEQASQENPNQEVLNILDMGMGPSPASDEDPYDDGPDEPIVLDLPSKPKRLPDNNDAPVDRSTQRDLREIKQKTPGSNASFKIYRKEFGNNINCGTFSRSELGNLRIDEFIQEHIAPVSPGPKNSRIWEYTYEIWANNRVVERGPVIRIDPNSVNDMVGDPVRELNNYPPSENARMDAATQLAATIMESQKFQAQQAIERERIAREDSKNNMDLFLKMMEMRQQNQGGGGDMMVMLPLLMKMMEPKVDTRPAQDPTLAIFAEKVNNAIGTLEDKLERIEQIAMQAAQPMPVPEARNSTLEMLDGVQKLMDGIITKTNSNASLMDTVLKTLPALAPFAEMFKNNMEAKARESREIIAELRQELRELRKPQASEGKPFEHLRESLGMLSEMKRMSNSLLGEEKKTEVMRFLDRIVDNIPLFIDKIKSYQIQAPNQPNPQRQITIVDYVKSLRYETDENIVTGIRNVFSTIMNSPNGDVVKKHLTADHEHNKTVFVRAVGKFLDGLKRQGEIDEITADRLQKITENRAGEIWPSLAQPSASSDSPQAESPES